METPSPAANPPASRPSGRRLAVVWGVLSLVLMPLAWGGDALKTTVVAAAWTLLVAAASGGALFLTRVRDGVIAVVDAPEGAPARPPRSFSGAMIAGAVLGGLAALVVAPIAWVLAANVSSRVGSLAYVLGGVLAPLATARLPATTAAPARALSRGRHLAETAVATALLAGPFGTLILWTRLPIAAFPEGALLRHFIGSTLLYGLLLGTATFIKAWTEVAWGLVVIPEAKRRPPHPLAFAAALCAALWATPGLNALDDDGALIAKLLGGAAVAVVFAVVGGARGQEAAFRVGRRGRRVRR